MKSINLRITGPDDMIPHYASDEAAGADLRACLDEPVTMEPGDFTLIPTGLRMAIPSGYEGQVRPRSGLAARKGLTVLNSPGTIDADYRGEVKVLLVNHGKEKVVIERGERIAQLLIAPVMRAEFSVAVRLDQTARGSGGFGSTGTR